jgi:hypothetical protein
MYMPYYAHRKKIVLGVVLLIACLYYRASTSAIFLSTPTLSPTLSSTTFSPISQAQTSQSKTTQIIVPVITQEQADALWVIEEKIEHPGTDAWVQKATDGQNIFIIKQINDATDEQFLLISDVVASAIGSAVGVPINAVSFIPYTVGAHLKKYPDRAATLHVYISGYDLEPPFPSFIPHFFTLHQRINVPQRQKKIVADNQQGVTRAIIESMSVNPAFSRLCAFDTFVGNIDRSPNIRYRVNQVGPEFYGIDQACAFLQILPDFAIVRIQELLMQGYFDSCAPEVIEGLRIYRDCLQELHEIALDFNLKSIMSDLVPLLSENAAQDKEIGYRINRHSRIFKHNRESSIQLIAVLDQVLEQKS